MSTATLTLTTLPPEILLRILSHLPIPDLLQLSRTSHSLRRLACDPILHRLRRSHATQSLSYALSHRASRASISPPHSWILLSKTNVVSRQISKSLIRIRLGHNLEHRPSHHDLVARSILPAVCARNYASPVSPVLIQQAQSIERWRVKHNLKKKLERRPSMSSLVSLNILPAECADPSISPVLVAARRAVVRERLKDRLRAWVAGRAVAAQKRKADEIDALDQRRPSVKDVVRRLAARNSVVAEDTELDIGRGRGISLKGTEKRRREKRWGREAEQAREEERRRWTGIGLGVWGGEGDPGRANVARLKGYWEGVIRAATV